MDRSLEELWSKRSSDFWREAAPYIRYMLQSGFPAFLSLVGIALLVSYSSFLRQVPEHYPIALTGAAALLPFVCWSPLRSWLVSADIVFLMPRESGMKPYILRSARRGLAVTSIWTAVAFIAFLPLYYKGAALVHPLAAAAMLALLKGMHAYAAWIERRMTYTAARRMYRLLRWALTAIVLVSLFTFPLWKTLLFLLGAAAAVYAALKLPRKHGFPWERLIIEEARTRRGYYRFFSMFIDVPAAGTVVAKRAYLAWLSALVPYRRRSTYTFLYTQTVIRTETGGILLRLTGLGALSSYFAAQSGSLDGWAAVVLCCLFTAVLGMQLGTVRHVHRYSVWQHVYPLPSATRFQSLLKVARAAHLLCAVLIACFTVVPLTLQGLWLPAAAAAFIVILYAAVIAPYRLMARMAKEREDD
ncbi:ABC transporter permease [Paenibacillus tarimensis]|uniref:ABC transporter permease n=1 Tax=Paenibacillus tarimensis TaxID=416012 RepID=UPI001F407980|nr:ABC transporter permease [Paenibacillus tarimensis]MCF2942956.1 ABC transporter permease [Paenibacillus tarimensis]